MNNIFIFLLSINTLFFYQNNTNVNKIVILTPYYVNNIDHKGCIDNPLAVFEQFIQQNHSSDFVRLNYKKLKQMGVEEHNIYTGKYCKPVGKVIGANLFVMLKINMEKMPTRKCSDIIYNFEIKAYSSITNKEKILWNISNITEDKFKKEIEPLMESIYKKIIELNNT